MVADGLHQRREQGGRSADPAGQRGAIEIDTFAGIDLRLPVQWNVVASTFATSTCASNPGPA